MALRPPSLDDAFAVERLINAVTRAEVGMVVYQPGDLLRLWRDGGSFEQHVVACDEDGAPEGILWVEDESSSIYFEIFLRQGAREGLASSFIDVVEGRAEKKVRGAGREIGLEVNSGQTSTTDLLERRGYRRGKTHVAMTIELDAAPEPILPDGMHLRPYVEGEDDELFFRTLRTGFGEDWDGPDDQESWFRKHRAAGYAPELWFFVEGDEGVLGAVHSRDTWENDVQTGWVRNLASLPHARRLGVGRILLLESFRRLAERGRRRAVLGVEDRNVVAIRFYGNVGMLERGRSTDLFKTFLPPVL